MAYDNTCKFLAETYPTNIVRWLLSIENPTVKILKTEIIPEPLRSDALILLQLNQKILHLEFQTLPYSQPPIPYRMLNYWTLLYGQYWCEIEQIVIYLKQVDSELVLEDKFEVQNTRHHYRVIRLWEEDTEQFLNDPALLPFATLAGTNKPENLLGQVAEKISTIDIPQVKINISAASEILAGLRFPEKLIRQLFREELMKESVIYQEILQTGIVQGEQRGEQRGEANILIKVLARKLGTIPPVLELKIRELSTDKLEALTDDHFDFSNISDLENWLKVKD
ncbi:Rpn family recombination-promoting nuclease/putative transposase [Anabaena sp. UHCC 0451]|uniref:Rpn family recombination-promoting nuclease/putative transposase n=1 Tax=Anabaena sp. UHCC 0451 TaxID=2055235 RepID=UPI002B1F66AD|nr:Rpn family recombination-promoting nuclease/putative transposase [Anabaena sp. UHCC 0451]MEA5576365.1 Rpn family recombination-promoting nuclease/putative transposase [Anabaena sp. UHCC 0451]